MHFVWESPFDEGLWMANKLQALNVSLSLAFSKPFLGMMKIESES